MSEIRTRRDISTLQQEAADSPWHPIVLAYARAVAVLRRRSADNASDPTGWTYQAAVHGMSPPPNDQFRNKCQHFGWFFLPWHRMYLLHFESIVRAVIEDLDDVDDDTKTNWALPYWDYTKGDDSRRLPLAFRRQTLPDGEPNPLFDASRLRVINNGAPIPDQVDPDYLIALEPEMYTGATGFGGAQTGESHGGEDPNSAPGPLEISPHGFVHVEVGGNMGGFNTAALDPVFWLHHANIDRIWEVWLGLGRQNPTENAWLTAVDFHFHDAAGAATTMNVDEVIDIENQLHYVYEDVSGPPGPLGGPEAMPPQPDHPAQLVGATEQGVQLTGETADVSFPVGEPAGPLEADTPSRVYLRLEGITADAHPGVPYRVYLNVDDDQPDTPDEHYVGTASMFGVPRRDDVDNDHPGMRLIFDITRLYQRLTDAGRWSDRVSVRFVPVYVAEPAGPQTPDEANPGTEQQPGPVTVGQVGVYFQ